VQRDQLGDRRLQLQKTIDILVVDDHQVVREGLKRILEECEDYRVSAEASNVAEALALLRKRPFDLMLLDISLPERTGLELLKMVKKELPKLPVLVLSAYREDHYAVRALKDGADGYLNKESASESLLAAIRKVTSGGKYLTPALAERIALEFGARDDRPLHETLSEREFQILKLIARGTSLKDIAERLHISAKTVTTYRARILEKTNFTTNAELTRYMLENNLLD
jgi:two-component system, NarL family, invasion response regulator UvrY